MALGMRHDNGLEPWRHQRGCEALAAFCRALGMHGMLWGHPSLLMVLPPCSSVLWRVFGFES